MANEQSCALLLISSCLLWCHPEFRFNYRYLLAQAKVFLIKDTAKALVTFSPRWKCAQRWSHQTWSWKKTYNIWWTFCQESWPLSLSFYLLVFSSSSSTSSSPTSLPALVMLGCVGPYLAVCARGRRGEAGLEPKCVWGGQINYVKVRAAMRACVLIVEFLCGGCRCRRLAWRTAHSSLSFWPLKEE